MVDTNPIVWLDGKQAASQPFLQLSNMDNVAVALRTLKEGEELDLTSDASASSSDTQKLTIKTRIMKGHKLALAPIASGERVLKYNQLIGLASENIDVGEHVHTHNLCFTENDAAATRNKDQAAVSIASTDSFLGYKRKDGRVGTRNYIAVISSVNCSATVAHRIAAEFNNGRLDAYDNIDGVAAFTHGTGCGMDAESEGFQNLQRVLGGYARHPNVGAVLLVGLGCETSQIAGTLKTHQMEDGPLLQTMNIQTTGGHVKTIARGVELIEGMLDEVNASDRVSCPVSQLTVALQCGGSDAWSGITANPALGYAADLIVQQGGTVVLAETPEIYGAEHLLTQRASEDKVADELMSRIDWWQGYVKKNNGSLDNNPSPGNKLGGLTTILEKSLGAVAKGGTTPLNGVLLYGETAEQTGFLFMDSPGYDPASVTGQIAGGCNLVTFTTGRGSTFGSKPAPCLKISTNTDMYRQMSDDMDIDAGTIVSAGDSVADVGQRIYQALLETASGTQTLSEGHGLGDNEFVPWQVGATM